MASLANIYTLAMQLFILNTLLSYTAIKAVEYDHTTNGEQTQCQNSKCNKYTAQELTDDELFTSGHLKPFGSHRPPDEIVEVLPFMISPQDFYMNYVIKHKPVVLKGAAKHWPAYKLWTDDYLNQTYGDTMFNMETKDDDKFNIPTGMKLKEFLEIYKVKNRYLVDEVSPEMRKEVILPLCLRCEEMDKYFFVSYFWFSQGNTSSQIHIDTDENMLCVIKGHKEVIMVSPTYSDDLYADQSKVLGVSDINVASVDLVKYPRVKNIRYVKAILQEGDMVYIPQMWWHQVNSRSERQQAVALWWKSKPLYKDIGRKSLAVEDYLKKENLEKKYSYANVLAEYELWLQKVSDNEPQITCNEQKVLMSEYQFETDKDPDAEHTLGDGGDIEEDDEEAYREMYKQEKLLGEGTTGIPPAFLPCNFDRENLKSPCHYRRCQLDNSGHHCIRYTLDYCAIFQDRGCVVHLPQLLNKLDRESYAIIKAMVSDFS